MPKPSAIRIAEKCLKDFFEVNNPLQSHPNGKWTLRQGVLNNFITNDEKGEYVIWQIPFDEDLVEKSSKYPFYMAFSIFLKADDEQIDNVNIKIFKEEPIDTGNIGIKSTELLLRAEWSNDKANEDELKSHAQPHWHIHAYKVVDLIKNLPPAHQVTIRQLIDDSQNEVNLFAQEMENVPAINEENGIRNNMKDIPLYKFHLAMLADWENAKYVKGQDNKKLDTSTLTMWLPHCLNYIRYQMEYILKKLPAI